MNGTDGAKAVEERLVPIRAELNEFWLLFGSTLVFFMQNVVDACLGALLWWGVGHAIAYGTDSETPNHFIGVGNYFMSDEEQTQAEGFFSNWMFQWAFAATAATVVSGAVSERCHFTAYMAYTCVMTGFIYPVAAHWVWSRSGWLSPYNTVPLTSGSLFLGANGLIDLAGSGVVHITGGTAALVAAYIIGPRAGRFKDDGTVVSMQGSSTVLTTLGTFVLWMGWYGFNCVSTASLVGSQGGIGRVAVTTTLSAATGGCVTLCVHTVFRAVSDVHPMLNGILAGLVSISAGAAVVKPYAASVIGMVGGLLYYFGSAGLRKLKIDDPLDASPIHLGGGMWGLLCVGFLASKPETCEAGYIYCDSHYGVLYGGGTGQLTLQVIGMASLLLWSCLTNGVLFFMLHRLQLLRVDALLEELGLDVTLHSGSRRFSPNRAANRWGVIDALSPPRSRGLSAA